MTCPTQRADRRIPAADRIDHDAEFKHAVPDPADHQASLVARTRIY
jgi:hypothetical protein